MSHGITEFLISRNRKSCCGLLALTLTLVMPAEVWATNAGPNSSSSSAANKRAPLASSATLIAAKPSKAKSATTKRAKATGTNSTGTSGSNGSVTNPVGTGAAGSNGGAAKTNLNAGSSLGPNDVPDTDGLGPLTPPPLPPEPVINHNVDKTMDIGPIESGPLIQIASLRPMRLEASYNEPFTLRDALIYAIDNNLPIKIGKETWLSQQHLFRAAMGGFLPNFTMNWNLTHTHIFPNTEANNRQFNTTVSQPVFQGGRVLYSALAQYYRARGWHYSYRGTINDTLLTVYTAYTNMLLNRALLQIRVKSVETDEEQLRLNEQQYNAGTGTRFAIMQSRSQLALDRQALLLQQVAVRQSALALGFALNMPLAINLVPTEKNVSESALVDENLSINDLLNEALCHRPDLRQYEYFRLAAARNVQVQAAQFYPTVTLFTTFSHTSTSVYGPSARGNPVTSNQAANVNNFPFSPTSFPNPASSVTTTVPSVTSSNSTITSTSTGTATTPTATSGSGTVSSGGNAAGTTSATAAPSTGQIVGGATTGNAVSGLNTSGLASNATANPGSISNQLGSSTSTIGAGVVSARPTNSVALGFQFNWTLPGLGYTTAENILSAKALARQALEQANQELMLVSEQVRSDYLNALTARQQIDVAALGVDSAAEEMRLARLRLETGVGTNLEWIQAQRDYITALVNQAQAIISSNQAQAQLLHDTGLISVETLTTGYHPPRIGSAPIKNIGY